MNVYGQDVLDSIATYGDAVIITLSRVGGEGYDLTFQGSNYLALDENEKAMMAYAASLKQAGKIKSIVVLINSSNALQVDFLKNNEYSVDACLWIGGVGANGTNAVTDILAGKVNRAMIIGKGSLFLGRMTNLFDGVSFVIQANTGAEKAEAGVSEEQVKGLIAKAMKEFAAALLAQAE